MNRDDSEEHEKVSRFLSWLRQHGASFPKISWPEVDAVSGLRGAHATEDIASDEVMLSVPACLMMAPPHAHGDLEVGHALRGNVDLLHGDLLLTVYLMHEIRKGSASFYFPYLSILPEPQNLTEWTQDELSELQDENLALRARSRKQSLQAAYERTIGGLQRRYPDLFPLEMFPLKTFVFAWNTIQARAFGRRLPWTALVPFADCLNHSNVQTKYSFRMNGNRSDSVEDEKEKEKEPLQEAVFELFPSGSNHYLRGEEAFNSYGRRPNSNLLLDYGFSLINNTWDSVEVALTLPSLDSSDLGLRRAQRVACLFLRLSASHIFSFDRFRLPLRSLLFQRVAIISSDEVDLLEDPQRLHRPLDRQHERRAAEALIQALKGVFAERLEDSLEQDEAKISEDFHGDGAHEGRRFSALVYRLTRKRIVKWNLELLHLILAILNSEQGEERGALIERLRSTSTSSYVSEWGPAQPRPAAGPYDSSDSDEENGETGKTSYLTQVDDYIAALSSL
eukprot:gene4401-4824_t